MKNNFLLELGKQGVIDYKLFKKLWNEDNGQG